MSCRCGNCEYLYWNPGWHRYFCDQYPRCVKECIPEHSKEYYIQLGLSLLKEKEIKEIKAKWYKTGSRV